MGLSILKPVKDEFEGLFKEVSDHSEVRKFFPIFREPKLYLHQGAYHLVKVEFRGIIPEVRSFVEKWSQREQHKMLLRIHRIFTNNLDRAVLYLDYPERPLVKIQEIEFMHYLDQIVQLMAQWQNQGRFYGYFGQNSFYYVRNSFGKEILKIIDLEMRPYPIPLYKKCLMQESLDQLRLLLDKFYLSPAQFEALAEKVQYPTHNPYKTDVYCLGLLLLSLLYDRNDFYELSPFAIKVDLIEELLGELAYVLNSYAMAIFRSMLSYDEINRPDFLQLNLQIEHFAHKLHYERVEFEESDITYQGRVITAQTIMTEAEQYQEVRHYTNEDIPEELRGAPVDMSFTGLEFTLNSETKPTPQLNTLPQAQKKSTLFLNNTMKPKQKAFQIEPPGHRLKQRIDLPILGYHDLKNWKTAEGVFEKEKLVGHGKLTFPNGDWFEGEFVNDKAEGRGTYYFADGTTKQGYWTKSKYQVHLI